MACHLTDKAIIITGASSGIGAATALACAKAGMNLVLNARREERLRDLAQCIGGLGRKAIIVAGDVTETDISQRMLDAADLHFGGFHAVFANAGFTVTETVVAQAEEIARRIFEVNFFAAVNLLRAAAQQLVERDQPGHLLMCSSCLSKFALPGNGMYSASKSAQNAICSAMRHELAHQSIYVSSVHPITTTTELFEVSAKLSGRDPDGAEIPDHAPALFVQPPERVARAVVKCLRKPRPEVWTSHIVRIVAGFMTISPRFYDFAMRMQMKSEMKQDRAAH